MGTPQKSQNRGAALCRLVLGCSACFAVLPAKAVAQDSYATIRNNYGGAGLIDMPSARMAPDGELGVSASFMKNIQHYNLTFQALPWLETSFKYSGLQHFDPTFPVLYDRSFGVKVRLFKEGDVMPALAIGINDLIGTGVYASEYLVASKQFGPLDTSIGMGWGRMATAPDRARNPLSLISSSFDNTQENQVGQFGLGRLFRGREIAFFGGAVWHTPIDNLSLIAEYSSDEYTRERAAGSFVPRSQVNLGIAYQPFDGLSVGLNWLYGRGPGLNVALQMDPTKDAFPNGCNRTCRPCMCARPKNSRPHSRA